MCRNSTPKKKQIVVTLLKFPAYLILVVSNDKLGEGDRAWVGHRSSFRDCTDVRRRFSTGLVGLPSQTLLLYICLKLIVLFFQFLSDENMICDMETVKLYTSIVSNFTLKIDIYYSIVIFFYIIFT